jgi:cobalt-zinc-cadmium efflux system protein
MAHHQKAVAAAVTINSAIFVVEAIAGYQADSLSLIMDSIHNLSDELALIFIYLAFVLSQGISRHLLRTANVFNSVGLVVVSVVLLWQSIERLVHPVPVQGELRTTWHRNGRRRSNEQRQTHLRYRRPPRPNGSGLH